MKIRDPKSVMESHAGDRVRIMWNPFASVWAVYRYDALQNDGNMFGVRAIELHTVSVIGDMRPAFAPEGTPSFIGTVCSESTLREGHFVLSSPYAPAKLTTQGPNGEIILLKYAKRLRCDGPNMICKL